MGLNAALKEKVEFANGGIKSANFSNYHALRMWEAPHIEIHLLESDAKIGGLGEPSLPWAAPSVTNALFCGHGGADSTSSPDS